MSLIMLYFLHSTSVLLFYIDEVLTLSITTIFKKMGLKKPFTGWPFHSGLSWCLLTSYGDVDLGHHWLKQWFVAWLHQGITWTNVDMWDSVAFTMGLFYQHGLTLITAYISNHMPNKEWNEIAYLQTATVALLKFGHGQVISPHVL